MFRSSTPMGLTAKDSLDYELQIKISTIWISSVPNVLKTTADDDNEKFNPVPKNLWSDRKSDWVLGHLARTSFRLGEIHYLIYKPPSSNRQPSS